LLPLTDFEKFVCSKIPHRPFLPTTLQDKATSYDPYMPQVSHARLRYCVYVRSDTVYVFWPWLHYHTLPENAEETVSSAMRSWSSLTMQPVPVGPILFGHEQPALKPGNPLRLLEQKTSALRQRMTQKDVVQEVHRWLKTNPTTVNERQRASLETLLFLNNNDEALACAVREKLATCLVE
jgi:dsDNA-binding SOS-regulon protein